MTPLTRSVVSPLSLHFQPLQAMNTNIRWMSSHDGDGDGDSPDAAGELLDILAREEQEEIDGGNNDMPADLKDLKRTIEQDWKLVEGSGDSATVNLYSKSSSPKVQISFHCQDTVKDVTEGYDDDANAPEGGGGGGGGGAADDDYDEEQTGGVRFAVTVTKAGKTLTMQCLSEYGAVTIETISTTTNTDPDTIHANNGVPADKTLYQGPEFGELAEDLQEAVGVYLDETCGVNGDVAAFIAMYADYKEQLHYVKFLKDAQSIVKP